MVVSVGYCHYIRKGSDFRKGEVDQGSLGLDTVNIGGADEGHSPSTAYQTERRGQTWYLHHPLRGKRVMPTDRLSNDAHVLPGTKNNQGLLLKLGQVYLEWVFQIVAAVRIVLLHLFIILCSQHHRIAHEAFVAQMRIVRPKIGQHQIYIVMV